MLLRVTNITTAPSGCGHLTIDLQVDGVTVPHVFHKGELWEAEKSIDQGAADKWDLLLFFLRSHILKYKSANPSATFAQLRAEVISNFEVRI